MGALAFAAAVMTMLLLPAQLASPSAQALWTISSSDCVTVHNDGEPWQECGFQAFRMNADGSRTLTVSTADAVQLWDGFGKQIARIDWPNEPGGASGYPTGQALIVGALGVAVIHQNQLLIVDLADGKILSRRVLPVMEVSELRSIGAGRVIAATNDLEWHSGTMEIVLKTGDLSPLPTDDAERLARSSTGGRGMSVTEAGEFVILLDATGRSIARLPRSVRQCGGDALRWTGNCEVSEDGHRLLVPVRVAFPTPQDIRVDLTLYALPAD